LYPIALNINNVNNVVDGDVIADVYNGSQSGNFGWLTWAGSNSEPTVAHSLTPPGDSDTYVNPFAAADHTVSVGDWVQGKPGVSNGSAVRDALDVLETIDIILPVWDSAMGQGGNTLYHVVAFARVHLISYHLPHTNVISAKFLGFACGSSLPTPTPTQ